MSRDTLLDMYLQDVSIFRVLTREEEIELSIRLREQGDESARQEMIQCNLRLVVSVARHFDNQGLPLLDVIEEGNIGLMRAVERFDPAMECRFSTYAVHWIKQAIRRSLLEKVKNIRVPAYMAELVARWKRISRENPNLSDISEICKALQLPRENVKLVKRILRTAQLSGASLGTDDVGALSSYFEDTEGDRPEAQMLQSEDVGLLHRRLDNLSDREAEILRYRFGLDDYPVLTLEEIGRIFSLTRERVRQIEAKALGSLRDMIPSDAVL
ncbi:MAG: sigma-70 family RNA polymerase sigma factor [Planctomycetota bacterium]